jgi:NADH:ubiquinone oxidoreductase subunit K
MAVIDIWQQFRTFVDGDVFVIFAMVLASSIPKTQLVKVCDVKNCVRCFQGLCPSVGSAKELFGPVYEVSMEIQTDVMGLSSSIESLTQTQYLNGVAQTTMAKLTEGQFEMFSRVEFRVICPENAVWDGKMCQSPTNRTWVGLGIVSVVLIGVGLIGLNKKRRMWLFSMETVKKATDVGMDGDEDYADEKTPVVGSK